MGLQPATYVDMEIKIWIKDVQRMGTPTITMQTVVSPVPWFLSMPSHNIPFFNDHTNEVFPHTRWCSQDS
jgi:hypothetical protein